MLTGKRIEYGLNTERINDYRVLFLQYMTGNSGTNKENAKDDAKMVGTSRFQKGQLSARISRNKTSQLKRKEMRNQAFTPLTVPLANILPKVLMPNLSLRWHPERSQDICQNILTSMLNVSIILVK